MWGRGTCLVGEGVHGDAESARKTKVADLELAAAVDQQVLRLQVAVQHAVGVAEGNALRSACSRGPAKAHLEQLIGEVLDRVEGKRATVAVRVHVPFQILLAELASA